MTNLTLSPRTAFSATAPKILTHGDLSLTECPDMALISVSARAGGSASVAGYIESKCGAPCPVAGYVVGPQCSAFWTGPDQWMVLSDQIDTLATAFKADLGDAASITDQSGGWVAFDLTGGDVTPAMERLCNINLSQFGPGQAQRTVIEHVSCFLLCQAPGRSYKLLCGRSFAVSFAHAVETAMKVTCG